MTSDKKDSKKQKVVRQEESIWPLVFAAVIFIVGVYLVLSALKKTSEPSAETEQDPRSAQQIREQMREEKIKTYKRELGEKLNRSRVVAEHRFLIEEKESTYKSNQAEKNFRSDLDGLPLSYQDRTYAPREPSQPVSDEMPDHKISYDLQHDQNEQFWEEEARRMFLRQYLLNARAHGFDVAIDQDYNVIVRKYPKVADQRMPQNVKELELLQPLRFKAPFFTPPPFCH